MKVALAIWNGRISPVFDVARQILLVDMENGLEKTRRLESLPATQPYAQVERLVELGVDVLICGAISGLQSTLVAAKGIRVVPFAMGMVEDVFAAWLAGRLPDETFMMPGCCGRMRRCHRRGAGWQG